MIGSNDPSRSVGTSISAGPISVSTVLVRVLLRMFSPIGGVTGYVTEILGQLRVQRCFEHMLSELAEQTTGPDQVPALFLCLHQ